ncbi:MAG: hypothetical protein NVSMB42_16750 [Herpetosiphon sp.]
MQVKDAKAVARLWVLEEATRMRGYRGAFYHGSINWLADDDDLPVTSDVDIMVVLVDVIPQHKLGKFMYCSVMLEVSYVSQDLLRSAAVILGQSHLAGSFRRPSVIDDPSGELTDVQVGVAKEYAQRRWVRKRCEHARDKIVNNLAGVRETAPFHDQVVAWLFAAGVTTHVLLVAGLKNPTVRTRYVAVKELLAVYGRSDIYPALLELLGCEEMSRNRVRHHLTALSAVFDVAQSVVTTAFPFAADISIVARPIAIDGSRALIDRGFHREAVFWMVATYSRCLQILSCDASAGMREKFDPGYRQLLGDLGISSFSDLEQRRDQIKAFLPSVWQVAEGIMATNGEIEDG